MRSPVMIEAGDENTAWGVVVPDLPGFFSAGDTPPPYHDHRAILLPRDNVHAPAQQHQQTELR